MPRVTILLTCYNHIGYIKQCIQSILDQTFQDFEVIALDDGSTDGTREYLSTEAPELFGDRLRTIFNERNLGTYGTLNVGLENASGEFIAIFNDDDVWAPTKLEKQVALLDKFPNVGLVHTNGHFIDGKGERFEGQPLGFSFPRTETGDVLLALTGANKIIASAVLARKKCFDELGHYNDAYFGSGDWEMWYRIAEKYDVGYVDEPLTMYRVHGANASHKHARIWKDDQMLREWMIPRFPSYEGRFTPDLLRKAEAHNWACLGTVRTLNGDPKGGRAAYKESLRLNPGRWQSRLRYLLTYLNAKAMRKFL